ncbi:MAG: response regulator [Pyrinomonadaceae bacterium]
MDIETELLYQINDSTLNCTERAWLRCELAKQLEEAGNYEAAHDTMSEFWQRVGDRPKIEGLDQRSAAEVLLRVGVLFRWIGSTRQLKDAQEKAKDLISESITIFETLRDSKKVAEALTELGCCYWRAGAFDEARVMLRDALSRLDEQEDRDLRGVALVRSVIVEKEATRYSDAFRILNEAAPLFETITNDALKGKFHNEFGAVLTLLGEIEHREDYKDRAFVEYAAASFHFEQAGHVRYQACVENNLGFLFFTAAKFTEAHEHLTRARRLLVDLKDVVRVAQVDETRARAFLAEGKNADAERLARSAVKTLEEGSEQHLLAEALTTHGIALRRIGQNTRALLTLQRAIVVAEQAGDLEGAGQAALTAIEELGEQFTPADLGDLYERAAEFLRTSQHPGILVRLIECARRVVYIIAPHVRQPIRQESVVKFVAPAVYNFSFWQEVERYEAYLIERGLKDAEGHISRAANLLGLSHQSLDGLLKGRHKKLFPLRTPPEPRRKSLFRQHRSSRNRAGVTTKPVTPFITILHVEDNSFVADMVKGSLEMENWRVVTCADGALALEMIESDAPYSLLLFDYDLPHVNGVELVRRARGLPHRHDTPIIVLSASNVEAEARSAGVDVFLLKPEGINVLVETIARLLRRNAG